MQLYQKIIDALNDVMTDKEIESSYRKRAFEILFEYRVDSGNIAEIISLSHYALAGSNSDEVYSMWREIAVRENLFSSDTYYKLLCYQMKLNSEDKTLIPLYLRKAIPEVTYFESCLAILASLSVPLQEEVIAKIRSDRTLIEVADRFFSINAELSAKIYLRVFSGAGKHQIDVLNRAIANLIFSSQDYLGRIIFIPSG